MCTSLHPTVYAWGLVMHKEEAAAVQLQQVELRLQRLTLYSCHRLHTVRTTSVCGCQRTHARQVHEA